MPREVGLIRNGDFDSADFSILTAKSSDCCVISIFLMRSGPVTWALKAEVLVHALRSRLRQFRI